MTKRFLSVLVILLACILSGSAQGIAYQKGGYHIELGGRIQVRHTYLQDQNYSNFNIPRIRLALKGTIYQNWRWEFQSDFARDREATLKDGLIEYTYSEQLNLRMGQIKVRYDRSQLESSGNQTFVERSLIAGRLGILRDIGLLLHGKTHDRIIQYSAGIFNGGGEGGVNIADRGHMLVARVSINPFGDFGLSQGDIEKSDRHLMFLDFALAQRPDSSKIIEGTTQLVGGIGHKYSGLYLQGEYYHRTDGNNVVSDGFYTQAGYMLLANLLEMAIRYSVFNPNKSIENNLESEIMGGLNVFLNHKGHLLKLSGDLTLLNNELLNKSYLLRTRLQAQVVF